MNAASPGVIALFQPNEFYPTQDAYLEALAEAMRPEYEAIVASGLILQLEAVDYRLTAVPGPSSYVLMGSGLVALF